MKKFICKVVIFLVGLGALDYVIGLGGRYLVDHAKGGDTGLNAYICRRMTEECLIFGSSRGMHHYDPNIITDSLGLSCWNCSQDGKGIFLMYGRYMMLSARYSPKVIIYDVCSSFDLLEGDNSTDLDYLRYFYGNPSVDSIFWDINQMERYKMLSSCYRFNSKWIQLISDNIHPLNSDDKGYRPMDKEMIYEPKVSKSASDDIRYDSLKLAYLEKLVVACQEKGTKLIFAVSPSYGQTDDTIYRPLKDICAKYNVYLLNHYCDSAFVANRRLFYDSVHMNRIGATLYSEALIKELRFYVDLCG